MSGILGIFLEALLGALTRAFQEWRADNDRIRTHEALGRKQVEDAQKKATLDAIADRQKIEDDISRMSDDDVLNELRRHGRTKSKS